MEIASVATHFVSLPSCRRIQPSNRGNHPQLLRVACGEKKDKKKLVKGLEKDLALFANMRFRIGLNSGLAVGVQESMINEAAEVIMRQLQCVREADKEAKKQRKLEKKKHKVKSTQIHGEVIDHESLQNSGISTPDENGQYFSGAAEALAKVLLQGLEDHDEQRNQQPDRASNNSIVSHPSQKQPSQKKLEICMGGKCRNSGAPQLLEQIQTLTAKEENANVVGCKCLGKCKTSPNMRLSSDNTPPTICSGVRISDVVSIISDFLEL